MKKKILILGSCVSRDTLNYDYENEFKLEEYYARSSLISLYSGKGLKNLDFLNQLSSPFQRKIVNYDLSKTFVEKIGILEFDILLLDFIDERFDIFEFNDGSKCTLSSEILSTDFLQIHQGKIIKSGSKEHLELWKDSWNNFVKHLKLLNILDKLVIQKSYWALNNDKKIDYANINYLKDRIENANNYLQQLFNYIMKDISPNQIITSSNTIGLSNHVWGESPFHYIDLYYIDILHFLKNYKINKLSKQNAYDIYALHHKVYNHLESNLDNIDAFLYNGIHNIQTKNNNKFIDILIDGIDNLDNSSYIIVCLGGAISNRTEKRGPFFSGINITRELNNTLISISDPTLTINNKISIGWYVGNKYIQNFPKLIASILDKISEKLCKKLLFIGGSAGGYGSLLINSYLKTETISLIWNPQIKIKNYADSFVKTYEKFALEENQFIDDYENIISDLTNINIPKNISILYLQNITDYSHCENQLYPFIKDEKYYKIGRSTLIHDENNIIISLGNFGLGHAVPSYKLLLFLIKHLMKKESIPHTSWLLDQGIKEISDKPPEILLFDSEKEIFPFIINYKISSEKVFIECIHEELLVTGGQFRFAFYLLSQNTKIETIWYSDSNKCSFDLPDKKDNLSVICFVKDLFGKMKSKSINIHFN